MFHGIPSLDRLGRFLFWACFIFLFISGTPHSLQAEVLRGLFHFAGSLPTLAPGLNLERFAQLGGIVNIL